MYKNTTFIGLFNINDSSPYVKLGLMAGKIATYNFEWRFNTLVMFNILHLVAIQPFLKSYTAVIVKKGKFLPAKRFYHTPQFVLFGQAAEELSDMLQWLMEHKYDNTARYVLVCAAPLDRCDEKVITTAMGETHIGNGIFLRVTDNGTEAFTIFPLKPNHKCWNNEPVKLNITYGCDRDKCYKNLYPEKFANLYKCPFRVSTFEYPPFMHLENGSDGFKPSGQNGDLLTLMVQFLNATLDIIIPLEAPLWGRFENNNWTGSLGDVFNGRARVSMTNAPLTRNTYGNFQISFTYDSMDIVWAAPLPALRPSWERLLYPLPHYLRVILFFMFLTVVFMNTFTKTVLWRKFMKVIDSKPAKTNLLIYAWQIFLGLPVVKIPCKNSFRMLIFCWLWYCLCIRSVYQATLVGNLKFRAYESKLDSFSDVLMKKYPFGGPLSLKDFYSEDPFIYNNWKLIHNTKVFQMLDTISKGETDFVMALGKDTIIDFLMKKRGKRHLQIVPEKIINIPAVMFFKKFSHMKNPVNKFLTIAVEGGFTHRLYAKQNAYVKSLFHNHNVAGAEPLRLVHFHGSLLLLTLGCFLAFIFFLIELACGRK